MKNDTIYLEELNCSDCGRTHFHHWSKPEDRRWSPITERPCPSCGSLQTVGTIDMHRDKPIPPVVLSHAS